MPGFELIGKEERSAVDALFDQGAVFFAHGFDGKRERYCVREFEECLGRRFTSNFVACVSSGTAAIKIALKALGVGPGDEVITQAFNFVATVEAIYDVGATPVVVGIDDTLNMSPESLARALSPKTKAIIPVHMLGVPAEMGKILAIASDHNVPVIEDACESVGALYGGCETGTLGDFGIFSFDFGKNITTGEGGALFCKSDTHYSFVRAYHDHGHMNEVGVPRGLDGIAMAGFNYRMTEISGALGVVQVARLDDIIQRNRARYMLLNDALHDVCELRRIPDAAVPSFDTFIMRVPDTNTRKQILDILSELGIGTKNLPDAMRWHCAYFWGHLFQQDKSLAVKEAHAKLQESVAIPIWLARSVDDYQTLASKLRDVL